MQEARQQSNDNVSGIQSGYPAAAIQAGSILSNRFLLEELLGEGGMGSVYKALDLRREEVQDPNPYVAIKLLNEKVRQVTGAGIALQREAVIAQRLQHSGIAAVYDYNRDESHAYIVMELIEGYTLDQIIISEYPDGLPVAKSFRLISLLIDAITFAHRQGVVHADIKPSNIKVLPGGGVKVMDFGLARVMSLMNMNLDSGGSDVDSQWRHRSLCDAITPSYATNARLQGRQPVRIDDAYALACVIYLVLTGRHPYQRMTAEKALKQGIKPLRPVQLSKKQWRILQRALDPNIAAESEIMKELSLAFCQVSRKRIRHRRKASAVAAFALLCASVVPASQWLSDDLPVWKIRYSDSENRAQQIMSYMTDDSASRLQALETILLPKLILEWRRLWSAPPNLMDEPLEEQKRTATALLQSLEVADNLTPYLSSNLAFVKARNQLIKFQADYSVRALIGYESRLVTYLTALQPNSTLDFIALYNSAMLLKLVTGDPSIIEEDTRLSSLLYHEMADDWRAGRYFPLGEKLQLAKSLFPNKGEWGAAENMLSARLSSGETPNFGNDKEPLFSDSVSVSKVDISLVHQPMLAYLLKKIKAASANQLDINPVYRDILTDQHARYVSLGGNEYEWERLVAQSDLDYARELSKWKRDEEAYQVVEEILSARLRL
ncbi:serine/threonine-protein kinase [Alkalimarinus coralli]|uniref:serine/threonine-protein kinase n=1 Tax=Alkalimarinus coralli TaxID=2935863 RepID=UPI00202B8C1B|nr:serine/threonine-protein kinase [Alkalimarinus coralli]